MTATAPVGPTTRPLGGIALGLALVGALLAPTYFLSLLAYPPAVAGLALGWVTRGLPAARPLGTVAMVVAGVALVAATVVLAVF